MINANHTLLDEHNRSMYHIPEYKKYDNSNALSESLTMAISTNMIKAVREAGVELSNELHDEDMYKEPGNIGSSVYNYISSFANFTIDKLRELDALNRKGYESVIYTINNTRSNAKSQQELLNITKALEDNSKQVVYPSHIPVNFTLPYELLDIGFPNVLSAKDTINQLAHTIWNDGEPSLNSFPKESSYDFIGMLDTNKDILLRKLFGKYDYDKEDISGSVKRISDLAYNSDADGEVTLTSQIYMQAYINLETLLSQDTVNKLDTIMSCYKSFIREAINQIEDIVNKTYNLQIDITKNSYSNEELKQNYNTTNNIVGDRIIRTIRVILEIANYAFTMLISKYNHIKLAIDQSASVVDYCDKLAMGDEDTKLESYEAKKVFDDVIRLQESINCYLELCNRYFVENSFNDSTVLNEAEGDNKAKVSTWLDGTIQKFTEILDKFKTRCDELLITRDKGFWEKNKDKIFSMNPSDTKVSDWYKYDIALLEKSSFVAFDINQDYMKSDESFQQKILDTISSGKSLSDLGDGSFAQKLSKLYQGEYVEKGSDKPISSVGYDHNSSSKFVDNMITNGKNSTFIKSIDEDYAKVKSDKDKAKNSYDANLQSLGGNKPAQDAEKQETKPDDGTPQKESAQDDFSFNVAECLGLMFNEASFSVGDNDSKNYATGDGSSTGKTELDNMMKRCFMLNTTAITARMTNILAAYKQYIGLYKYILNTENKK